eukprot:TRINITY_DN347_c0_g2_i4.p2 TRINITY_DN347_c0_g2~~TRINITY_DN347_c0_g2_i4.p2  ORF type:complete len:191 (+),score=43.16 TRINITY_DN347_c0_g2_i4:48-575(+)
MCIRDSINAEYMGFISRIFHYIGINSAMGCCEGRGKEAKEKTLNKDSGIAYTKDKTTNLESDDLNTETDTVDLSVRNSKQAEYWDPKFSQANSPKDATPGFHVSVHEHDLFYIVKDDGWRCNGYQFGGCVSGIKAPYETATMDRYNCKNCHFDLCKKCLEKHLCQIQLITLTSHT